MLSRLTCDGIQVDKKHVIFKAITGSSSNCIACTLWRRLFDAGLVALESISPRKGICYGTLRCRTLLLPYSATFLTLYSCMCILCFSIHVYFAENVSNSTLNAFRQKAWPELPVTGGIALNILSHVNRGTESICIVASPVLRRRQLDCGESCIVLESGPTRIALLPSAMFVGPCSTRISWSTWKYRRPDHREKAGRGLGMRTHKCMLENQLSSVFHDGEGWSSHSSQRHAALNY